MKTIFPKFALIVALSFVAALSSKAQRSPATPLTNAAVIKLVRAGFKEKTIIAIIRNRTSRFTLDPDRLIDLKRNGVSENIILAMLSQDESFVFSDDEWTLGSTMRTPGTGVDGDQRRDSDGGDIFGSSGGSRGNSAGRGLSNSNQEETTTTGSATVRILRPPAEAGGGSAKLEKTPTLNNESVIRLVEAGFSEGTIIKRIEDSPADFDLSNPKLQELRRRRVTEPIISAMTAAMSEDAITKPGRTKGN